MSVPPDARASTRLTRPVILDLANDATEWVFPSWSHPILGHMAVGMHKAGIDYDQINARQAAFNGADAQRILQMLEAWDDEKQRAAISQADPTHRPTDGFRPNASQQRCFPQDGSRVWLA
jgi:hypothetical protein